MKKTLVIVADLGNFKAYYWDADPFHSHPRLEMINSFEVIEARGKRANTLTTMEKGSTKQASHSKMSATGSDGEQHNMHLEKRRRVIRETACLIADFLKDRQVERCFMAAPEQINHQLVDSIAPDLRRKIEKNLVLNLTQVDKGEIIDHFADHRAFSQPQPSR